MPITVSGASSTRLQDFRQRNRSITQVIRLMIVIIVGCVLYSYILLYTQTDRDHQKIVRLNVERSKDDWRWAYMQNHLTKAQRKEYLRAKENVTNVSSSTNDPGGEESDTPEGSTRNRWIRSIKNLVGTIGLVVLARMLTRSRMSGRGSRRSWGRGGGLEEQERRFSNRRFRHWVSRLNRQRVAQGERPFSPAMLRLVLRDREPNGDDYDGLLTFQEQAGPALQLLQNMGATDEEIARCPTRTLQEGDDLLQPNNRDGKAPTCAVCLETYQTNDIVRTIPCFHSFHKGCIDPWLAQKALCPICKHSAIS